MEPKEKPKPGRVYIRRESYIDENHNHHLLERKVLCLPPDVLVNNFVYLFRDESFRLYSVAPEDYPVTTYPENHQVPRVEAVTYTEQEQ